MPSVVRNLTHLPRGEEAKAWPEDRPYPSIDRDIDLAIREFAPGQRVLRDGRFWSADGLMRPEQDGRPSTKDVRPYDASWWLYRCSECEISWLAEANFKSPFPTKSEVEQEAGHKALLCRCGAVQVTPFLALTPAGFKTDGELRTANDENDDGWTIHDVRLVPEWGSGLRGHRVARSESSAALDTAGCVLRVNLGTDRAKPGFSGQFHEHRQKGAAGDPRPQLFSKSHDGAPDAFRIALLSRMRTDQFWLSPAKHDAGLLLDPGTGSASQSPARYAVRAAFESAAELLVHCAARDLDVNPEEFIIGDISKFAESGDNTLVEVQDPRLGRIHIADRLANGSGYSAWLFRQLPTYFDALRGESEDKYPDFIRDLLRTDHMVGCQTSCYRCLRTYGTRRKHARLHWRFGLDLLRVLAGANRRSIDWLGDAVPSWWRSAQADGAFSFVNQLAKEFATLRKGTVDQQSFGTGVPVVSLGDENFAVIHPLRTLQGAWQLRPGARPERVETLTADCFTLQTAPSRAWVLREHAERCEGGDGWVEATPREVSQLLKFDGPDARVHVEVDQGDKRVRVEVRWADGVGVVDCGTDEALSGTIRRRMQRFS